MTLTIRAEEDDQRQVELTVEVSEDRVEEAMRRKARQLAGEFRVPGFRRGKVPYNVVLQRFGRELVRAEAVEDMVQGIYEEATTEKEIVAYGRPSLDDMQVEPLVMKFTVPLEPIVDLGDYRALRKDVHEADVSDEAVAEALEQVQASHQELESVDRPAQLGDVVTISGQGFLAAAEQEESADASPESAEEAETAEQGERLLFDEESLDILLDEEKVFAGTRFVANLAGASTGDDLAFELSFPDDYEEEDLAGRKARFEIKVLDVKRRDLPPLDDELAKLEGDYESLEELRVSLRERLEQEATDQLKEDVIEGMVDDLLERAELHYPPAAVEMEIDETLRSFRNQVQRSGWDFEDYLKLQNLSEEKLREDFRESSEKRLRRQLVIRQFVLDEKLRIESADVEALIEERVGWLENEELRNGMRDFYQRGFGFDTISSAVLSDKVFERTKAILAGEAPELADLEEVEQTAEEAGSDEEE